MKGHKQKNFKSDEKKILAVVVEIGINLVMSTHVYTFCGKFYLKCNGGHIGLRSTACLASLIMKLWDTYLTGKRYNYLTIFVMLTIYVTS